MNLWSYAVGYGDFDEKSTFRLYFSSGVNERAEDIKSIYLQHNTGVNVKHPIDSSVNTHTAQLTVALFIDSIWNYTKR